MGFQLKLLGFVVFLLPILSCFCHAKTVTIKVIGSIHCTDCIRHEFSNSHTSPGVDVFISCKTKNKETKTQGNSAIDKQGKFNITFSSEITEEDENSIEGCFAKLQTESSGGTGADAPCPLQSAQTASVELLTTPENAAAQTTYNKPTTIEFSPVTCQSAFFWPMPNLTFFPTSPPPAEYAPPPSQAQALSPVQPPLPPASEPPYLPQVPSLPPPTPAPMPAPAFQSPQNAPNPIIKSPSPPPLPPPPTPLFQHPISPIPPKKHKKSHSIITPIAPPTPALSPLNPPQAAAPPTEKKPCFIPRAPPVPVLPPTPQAPRKYFNAPKSKSKPPHSF